MLLLIAYYLDGPLVSYFRMCGTIPIWASFIRPRQKEPGRRGQTILCNTDEARPYIAEEERGLETR